MTWRSAINNPPAWDEVDPFPPDGYEEWLEMVMAEPWVTALEDLVKCSRLWVGTEEQLLEEIEMRVGESG